MIVAIHQPNVLPWVGYFDKMLRSDVFVYLDDVEFSSQSYTQRVQFNGDAGPWWLTVPTQTGASASLIREVEISDEHSWRKDTLRRIEHEYRDADGLDEVLPVLRACLMHETTSLDTFNRNTVETTLDALGKGPKRVRSPDLGIQAEGTERLIRIVTAVGGDTYLSGHGAKDYQDETAFQEAGIELRYVERDPFEYPQVHDGFEPGLSLWDAFLNLGFDEVSERMRARNTEAKPN